MKPWISGGEHGSPGFRDQKKKSERSYPVKALVRIEVMKPGATEAGG